MAFLGRQHELDLLNREYDRTRPSLVVVYGRRRVGKSTLLLESLRGRPHLYHQASKLADPDNRALFRRTLLDLAGDDPLIAGADDWPSLLAALERLAFARAGLVVVLDEFPYLCEAEPALPSLVQAAWDRIARGNAPLTLVLCGSSIAFMETLLAERNPLHGRQTLELDVAPLSYRDAAGWFPAWPPAERLRAYSVFGGMPYYLSRCDPAATLADNVRAVVLERGAPLHDEPTHLLQAELTTTARYASVLRAIADGLTEWGDIVNRVGDLKTGGGLAPYILRLEGLRLVRVERSLDADERARNRRYRLADPFLVFWYRFVLPSRSALEAGHDQAVWERIVQPALDDHAASVFEDVCRDFVRLHGQEVLGEPALDVGKIWGADFDLDVAGRSLGGRPLFGECKWWRHPVGENVLDRLVEARARTRYGRNEDADYLVFAREGFTERLRSRAEADPSAHLVNATALLGETNG